MAMGKRRRGSGKIASRSRSASGTNSQYTPQAVVELVLKEPELSPLELAVSFVDKQQYFVSVSPVCRLLKVYDLITSLAFMLKKAADHHPPISSGKPKSLICA